MSDRAGFRPVEGWMYCGLSPDGHGGLGVFWRSPDNPATPAEYHLCGSCRPVFQRVDSNGAPIRELMLDGQRTFRPVDSASRTATPIDTPHQETNP